VIHYHRNYVGDGVVADFRRLLKTGDVAKLTPRLEKATA
jgi:hypothetical protein